MYGFTDDDEPKPDPKDSPGGDRSMDDPEDDHLPIEDDYSEESDPG